MKKYSINRMDGHFFLGPIYILSFHKKAARLNSVRPDLSDFAEQKKRGPFPSLAHPEVVKALIPASEVLRFLTHAQAMHCMVRAARYGNLEGVKYLVSQGFDPDSTDNIYYPIEAASQDGQLEVVRYLVSKKVRININKNEPAIGAAINGYLRCAEFLSSQGAEVTDDRDFALNEVAFRGLLNVINYLIKEGANVKRANGKNALFNAAEMGYIEVVKYLVHHGSNISLLQEPRTFFRINSLSDFDKRQSVLEFMGLSEEARQEAARKFVRSFHIKEMLSKL